MDMPREASWELAAKIAGVLAFIGGLLKWLLTPMFVTATRRALEPELKLIADASTKFAAGEERFTAHDRRLGTLETDMREIRERVDDIADGRK